MSRVKSLMSAGLLAATMAFVSIGGAGAAATLESNIHQGNGPKTENCQGVHSAKWTGNGSVVRYQAQWGSRSDLVHDFLDSTC